MYFQRRVQLPATVLILWLAMAGCSRAPQEEIGLQEPVADNGHIRHSFPLTRATHTLEELPVTRFSKDASPGERIVFTGSVEKNPSLKLRKNQAIILHLKQQSKRGKLLNTGSAAGLLREAEDKNALVFSLEIGTPIRPGKHQVHVRTRDDLYLARGEITVSRGGNQ